MQESGYKIHIWSISPHGKNCETSQLGWRSLSQRLCLGPADWPHTAGQVQNPHQLFVLTCDGGAGEGGPKTLPCPCHFCSLVTIPWRCKDQSWVTLRVGFQFLHTHTSVQAHVRHVHILLDTHTGLGQRRNNHTQKRCV